MRMAVGTGVAGVLDGLLAHDGAQPGDSECHGLAGAAALGAHHPPGVVELLPRSQLTGSPDDLVEFAVAGEDLGQDVPTLLRQTAPELGAGLVGFVGRQGGVETGAVIAREQPRVDAGVPAAEGGREIADVDQSFAATVGSPFQGWREGEHHDGRHQRGTDHQ